QSPTIIAGDGPWTCMSLTQDGSQVAASGAEPGDVPDLHSEAAAWRTKNGCKVAGFNEGATKGRALAYSPNGARLALVREKRNGVFAIDFINPAKGLLDASVASPVSDVTSMAYTPDGSRLVLADRFGQVHLLEASTACMVASRPFPGKQDNQAG